MKYYKLLRTNRARWYDDKFVWPLHKAVVITDPTPGPKPCGRGLHLAKTVDAAFKWGKLPGRVFEAEPCSPVLGEDSTKIRVASAQLKEEIALPWLVSVNRFIKSMKGIKWFRCQAPAEASWRMFPTWAAARDAARDAAWDAARAAARAAELLAMTLIVEDLPDMKQRLSYARKRWRVWQKGYGLLGDVEGTFYVYKKV